MINVTIPLEDREWYEIPIYQYLEDIDKGDPFVLDEDKRKNSFVKKLKIFLKRLS